MATTGSEVECLVPSHHILPTRHIASLNTHLWKETGDDEEGEVEIESRCGEAPVSSMAVGRLEVAGGGEGAWLRVPENWPSQLGTIMQPSIFM